MLEFQLQRDQRGGSFIATLAAQPIGRIDFREAGPGVLDIVHTEVRPQYEGQGFGRQLVKTAAGYAREHGFLLKASCSYAFKVLQRDPELASLLV